VNHFMNTSEAHKIRPAGRHILTIGRDLIQDHYAAIVELVKNAYDADSPIVNISFTANTDRSGYSITIEDCGHGMSRETVINKWMVPSTDDKLTRKVSPGGRTMQGRKGVGRYATSILGRDLLLESVTPQGEKTTVFVEWDSFESAQYLDDVEILIETTNVKEPPGTRLTITGEGEALSGWNATQIKTLKFELKKLMSPISASHFGSRNSEDFQIKLRLQNFLPGQEETIEETIESFPLFDLYDYRVAGEISAQGNGSLTYSIQKARNTTTENIEINLNAPTGCGNLIFDIRVYDREKEAIESLIRRGLKDKDGNYVGKLEARQLLNENNGIGVYRNGFRIRPLGDAEFDWLKLNEKRVQNPSLRIGSNQAIGYVQIGSEETSGLIEKSARDGLRENFPYTRLKDITNLVIGKLEDRRFAYRRKAGLSRPLLKVERELEQLFSFEELKRGIQARLAEGGLGKKAADEIINIISKEEESKNKIAEDIRKTVAVYQGQATLGKIINVILHEGRRPLNYFKNQVPNLQYWYNSTVEAPSAEKLKTFLSIAEGVGQNAEFFVQLFGRLDPLAAGRRSERESMLLKRTIEKALEVFQGELKTHNISVSIVGPDDFLFLAWPQDLYAIFTNLVDNSIYWMMTRGPRPKEISIIIEATENQLQYIDFRDSGPGIEPALIASGVIFEPEFSTKNTGNASGLGLAIAGEAASRNGLELKAFESDRGAYFRLQPKTENENGTA
jgi:signal transduction histidine kinase